MSFSEFEIAQHSLTLEQCFWSNRRPPLHLRDRIRDGQRSTEQPIELFFVRPAYARPGEYMEDPIAKLTMIGSKNVWRIFWKRADGK